jgi:hypothetical protein
VDHTGGVHIVTSVASAAAPPEVAPHQTVVTFKLTARLPSGEGLIRYHPADGVVLAAWDYAAETG